MGVWGDRIFENDSALDWLSQFGDKLTSIIRSAIYEMKNESRPYSYGMGFHDGFVMPLYIYWILINKISEMPISPPDLAQVQQWKQEFNAWQLNRETDKTPELDIDYNQQLIGFTMSLLERLLIHASWFEVEDFDDLEGKRNKNRDVGYLPMPDIKYVRYFDHTGLLHHDIFDALKWFIQSSFYENTLVFDNGDSISYPTSDTDFMAAVRVMYLMSRYCRYVHGEDKLTTQHILFKSPRPIILRQWKDAYLKYLSKNYSNAEIQNDNYFKVRINLFDDYIQFAQEYEKLEQAEIEKRRKGDGK